jgi:ADP-ribose diphosphatase
MNDLPERVLPETLSRETIAQTRIFRVEALHLRFNNNVERHYERLVGGRNGAVMMVPLLNDETVLLTREYAAGMERYEIALPKGLIEPGETALQAANRELQEEVGFGARKLTALKSLSLSPGYLTHKINVVLAEELFESRLPGDEPESIDVIHWPLRDLESLFARDDISEARSIAALLMVREQLRLQGRLP